MSIYLATEHLLSEDTHNVSLLCIALLLFLRLGFRAMNVIAPLLIILIINFCYRSNVAGFIFSYS